MKSLRKILWNSRRPIRPIAVQLEFHLPTSKLTRSDQEILEGLRRLRKDLSRE
ncbi:MAG: hypothetical protein IAE94_03165 [Chthoniobacterales bacterium]|nr:hypothetical protein [Chthoniobacterales bacterium]